MVAYYNEIEPYAAAWLRSLIAKGLIADGVVDDRSIRDVRPDDLRGFTQCHFFAGIGIWSYALRLAGWADDRPVWTGSCPCQPFSTAGKRKGVEDDRHLWPELFRLTRECRPAEILGEQVASRDGLEWLAGVRFDLESAGYSVGAADLCAAGVGAPHIRQRLYWGGRLEYAPGNGREQRRAESGGRSPAGGCGEGFGLGGADGAGSQGRSFGPFERSRECAFGAPSLERCRVRLADSADAEGRRRRLCGSGEGACPDDERASGELARRRKNMWGADWITGPDGKARRVKPGIQLLADGVPSRVAKLRAIGNAIVPQVAAQFIASWAECTR